MLRPTVLTPLLCSGYRKDGCFENIDAFSRNNYVIVGSRTLHCQPPQVYQPTPETPPKISEYYSSDTIPLSVNVHNFGVLLFLAQYKPNNVKSACFPHTNKFLKINNLSVTFIRHMQPHAKVFLIPLRRYLESVAKFKPFQDLVNIPFKSL